MSRESVMPSNHLILCHLLLLPSIFPSIRVFSNESALHISWPKYWSFSFNISPSNEHPGLISFKMNLLDLLAVQGTLKSLLQHHSSKASILRHSVFFIVQFSYPYMTTGKTIALTRRIFVGKVMSLLYNMLSRFVIAFLLRSKCIFISRLQSASGVIPFSLGWNWGKEVIFPYSCEILKSWLWCRINAQGSGSQSSVLQPVASALSGKLWKMYVPGLPSRPTESDSAVSVWKGTQGILMWPHLEDHCPHSLRSAPPPENTWDLFLIFKRFLYLWLCWVFIAVRGLSLVIACRGFPLVVVHGLLIAVASRCGAQTLGTQAQDLWYRLSCPVACGIFPDHEVSPCPLHWQADTSLLDHQGSPHVRFKTDSERMVWAVSWV